ncbi:MAG: DUF45 domain-containing protein [Parasporobacterium sp.]|nr:DUF45 domain-containing protein [Parasporobacterium sp.]
MTKYININGIEIELQKKKIKNLHLHVRPDGSVYLSVPKWVSEAEAVRFARLNADWIRSQKRKFEEKPGKEYYEGRKKELEEKIRLLLPVWEERTGLYCDSWHTRYMTSRWGSCIPSKKRLCFNLQLVDQPEASLQYVILHELLHLRHPGHGAEFKRDLSFFMPDWKTYSNQLKA